MSQPTQLRPDQVAIFRPLADALDARAEGYRSGIEDAKRVLLRYVLSIPPPQERQEKEQ